MKKLIIALVFAAFSASAMAAQQVVVRPDVKGLDGLKRLMPRKRLEGGDWIKYTPDPAFSYAIKAQRQICDIIEDTCRVIETYWINGSTDSDRCNVTPAAIANEINTYANLAHANDVMIRCNDRPEYANIQYVTDINHDGITEISKFFRWVFTVVRQDKNPS